MIVVVADDFTGAAELGGIGLRYSLQVEMSTRIHAETKADLLIIATDSRSMMKNEAVMVMEQISRQISQLQPELIYKKIDSALRGHIIPEVMAQLNVVGSPRALIVPANPNLGRTLVNGNYYYHHRPIHLSSFSEDPEFAITSSEVLDILGANQMASVFLLKCQEPMPAQGIMIGEVRDARDLKTWAGRIDRDTLLAGASEFFTALLDRSHTQTIAYDQHTAVQFKTPALYVCGSTFQKSRFLVSALKTRGGPVSYMPEEILASSEHTEELYEEWARTVISYLQTSGRAIIAIDPAVNWEAKYSPSILREKTAQIVKKVFHSTTVHELFLEGGSTASAVLQSLGMHRFQPVQEIAPGVIRMQIADQQRPLITLKPGSYDWPLEIWP